MLKPTDVTQNIQAGLTAAPTSTPNGITAILEALALGGLPSGNIANLPPIFGVGGLPQKPSQGLNPLVSPLQQPNKIGD